MENKNKVQQTLDLSRIIKILWSQKKKFYKVWIWTFILSCIWIFPQPRYYTSSVALAPEMNGEEAGGLSSIASSFGFNIGGMTGQDAIYPELYPELFESPEFIVGLYGIQIQTMEKEGEEPIKTNYYTYIRKHQKKNWLTQPYYWVKSKISNLLSPKEPASDNIADINPSQMSYSDYMLMQIIMSKISCAVDKKTSVITISVTDQDPLVSATMADSIKSHLQDFIIRYRTSKAKEDVAHYQQMRDSAEADYIKSMEAYSRYCDTHMNTTLQVFQSERDKLESDMVLKQNALAAMETQLQTTKVKLQEKTPAFTILKSAIVPVKPAGPKRMFFVIGMLILATTVRGFLLIRKYII